MNRSKRIKILTELLASMKYDTELQVHIEELRTAVKQYLTEVNAVRLDSIEKRFHRYVRSSNTVTVVFVKDLGDCYKDIVSGSPIITETEPRFVFTDFGVRIKVDDFYLESFTVLEAERQEVPFMDLIDPVLDAARKKKRYVQSVMELLTEDKDLLSDVWELYEEAVASARKVYEDSVNESATALQKYVQAFVDSTYTKAVDLPTSACNDTDMSGRFCVVQSVGLRLPGYDTLLLKDVWAGGATSIWVNLREPILVEDEDGSTAVYRNYGDDEESIRFWNDGGAEYVDELIVHVANRYWHTRRLFVDLLRKHRLEVRVPED